MVIVNNQKKEKLPMKNLLKILLLLFASSTCIFAQSDSLTHSRWTNSMVLGFNISQISFQNWTQGGENSISWTGIGLIDLIYTANPWILKNNLKLAYGRTKLGTANYKTNDNELYFETVLSYNVGWPLNPFFSNTIRTVLGNGFDYSKTPAVKTSKFFDPGYVTQSLGFKYSKDKVFSSRLGIAIQETFADQFAFLYVDDPSTLDKIEKYKIDTGIESVTEGAYQFLENMLFTSKLRLFSRFNSLDVWDVRWDNTISAQINKYFTTNLNVLLIYEKRQSPKTQLKEALQLGITYRIM